MPRFDGTGPVGMGPMTGGARGPCNQYGRPRIHWGGFDSGSGWGQGRGRGYRHMYWATRLPRWMRFEPTGPRGSTFGAPYTREQEVQFLRNEAAALKEEMEAIGHRLRELESEESSSE